MVVLSAVVGWAGLHSLCAAHQSGLPLAAVWPEEALPKGPGREDLVWPLGGIREPPGGSVNSLNYQHTAG